MFERLCQPWHGPARALIRVKKLARPPLSMPPKVWRATRLIQAACRAARLGRQGPRGAVFGRCKRLKKAPGGWANRDISRCNGGTDAHPALLQGRQNR